MFGKPHTALLKYKAGREGTTIQYQEAMDDQGNKIEIPIELAKIDSDNFRWVRLGLLAMVLVIVGIVAIPHKTKPVQLTYEMDLSYADQGTITITLIAAGDLPGDLDLEFPPGVFGDAGNGVTPHAPTAHELDEAGNPVRPLAVRRNPEGWNLSTRGSKRAGFIYQVDLANNLPMESDVRRHISTPIAGGLRVAGFEVFLQPLGVEVEDITVTIHNPERIPVLVPWPALVRNRSTGKFAKRVIPVAGHANLAGGQSYRPKRQNDARSPRAKNGARTKDASAKAAPVPSSLLFHPRDLADLNNSLIICGDITTASTQARDCVIQLATDREWQFVPQQALDLVRRIARTQMGFFGSAPTPQITVLLAANEITAESGFDTYGVHTGSSVLVMMNAGTTYGELEAHVASVISHEMFHGWLGEAIPQQDLEMLWFTEGATTWYAARMLNTAGIWSSDHARAVLRARLKRDFTDSPHFGEMPIATAAKGIMADANQVRFGYAGGMNAVMALDAHLAIQSGKRRPLDMVLKELYRKRDGSPLTRQQFVDTVRTMTGVDCDAWLEEHVYNKSDLPAADSVL